MDLQLKGKRALVTGSSSGIGSGIARMLAEEGCAVAVHGRDRAKAERVVAEIGAAGAAIGAISSDEDAAAVHEQACVLLGGPIEILVNNAGGSQTGSNVRGPLAITADEWIRNYNANALGAVRMCLLAVPAMVEARWGRVIQISSAVAIQPNNLGSDYSGAKAARQRRGQCPMRRRSRWPIGRTRTRTPRLAAPSCRTWSSLLLLGLGCTTAI